MEFLCRKDAFSKEISFKINFKAVVLSKVKMDRSTKVNGNKIRKTAKEFINGRMVIDTKVRMLKEKEKEKD